MLPLEALLEKNILSANKKGHKRTALAVVLEDRLHRDEDEIKVTKGWIN